MTTALKSQEQRFRDACQASEERGAPVRLNDLTVCCRSCYETENESELYNLTQDGPLVWHRGKTYHVEKVETECSCEYDDEDDDTTWGEPSFTCAFCRGLDDDFEKVYRRASGEFFYFRCLLSAEVFAEELRNRGFAVDWDGTQSRALHVLF